jgi:acetyltransferase-like isoleucine patch superfamily enzyme
MEITDNGKSNKVVVPPSLNGRLMIKGNHNLVVVGDELASGNLYFEIDGDHSTIEIGAGCNLGHLFIYQRSGAHVRVGNGVGFNGLVRLLLHEPASIDIGAESLFAGNVDVTVSDMHPIFDLETEERINPARGVVIGEHCWIGQNSLILKGAKLGSGCVIGASSTVSGAIPGNTIAAGFPARVIRRGIFWRHEF